MWNHSKKVPKEQTPGDLICRNEKGLRNSLDQVQHFRGGAKAAIKGFPKPI